MGNTSATNITLNIYIHRVQEAVITLRAKLSGAVYCYRSCLWQAACVCGLVCYHENSKLCALIFIKLGL